MHAAFFIRGLVIGFSIAAPVGPIGILCIRRSLRDGMRAGFTAGLGAATADATYGAVAGFGLASVSNFLVGHGRWIGIGGGAFLCYLGARAFLSRPAAQTAPESGDGLMAVYGSTLFLTLANPATILSFAAIFATFGMGALIDYAAARSMVLGVFAGSTLWWAVLSGGVCLVRSRVNPGWMKAVNRLSGAVLIAFGLVALWRALTSGP